MSQKDLVDDISEEEVEDIGYSESGINGGNNSKTDQEKNSMMSQLGNGRGTSERRSDEKENSSAKKEDESVKLNDEIPPSLVSYLKTDPRTGLTTEEAKSRLGRFGRNEISETKTNPIMKFASYFRGPIAYLIEIACIVAAIVRDWVDFGIIFALLVVNACIGFFEESRAESALDALRQTLALKSRVMRDGKLVQLDSAELVPGDVIVLRIGDIVPADSQLLGVTVTGNESDDGLLIDQSALTAGAKTFIGRAATLMNMTVDQGGDVLSTLQLVLVLTVAAIPVGLPTVLSVTMAVGAKQLASKKVIIKRLTAVEELASVNLLCTDKTGTLTLNDLTFDEPWLYNDHTSSELLLYSYLCSESDTNDAIETAVRKAAESELDILKDNENDREVPGYKVTSFVPFNPSNKYTRAAVINLKTGEKFQIVKGAPQVIIKLAGGDEEATKAVDDFASRGLRALGVAKSSPLESDKALNDTKSQNLQWNLIGLISLLDPPRPDSGETLNRCREFGVIVKMVTGDQVVIAKEVARRLGMSRVILDANYLVDSDRSEEEVTESCERADGFAQVIPEHKYKVVENLSRLYR
ncbi:949_t:CDS:2 [Acaulospora colombiana]|uniref:949_t:CDS:1 n=1 Tax=Acaulospora colombiana TaxID=27376 RepID=A0ACA9K868_9GLOM|nr:949_t:CDS:2 [Acaulospora colombiana]